MSNQPRVYVDFLNTDGRLHADGKRRILLNTIGSKEDIAAQKIELQEGLRLLLYSDDAGADGRPDPLVVEGMASFDSVHDRWVAVIDWDSVRHESDLR